jgi:hypothetical protein
MAFATLPAAAPALDSTTRTRTIARVIEDRP